MSELDTSTNNGPPDGLGSKAAIWQGYHHAWEYNHRVNRFGSYVRYMPGDNGHLQAVVGHTAASGTGGDVAHFSDFVTQVESEGVGFQVGQGEIVVDCPRAETALFRMKVEDVQLAPEVAGRANYAVVLNGFDLIAGGPAAKILSFDLEVTDPTVYAGGSKIRFNVLGSMSFDCRSTECQLWPFRLEVEDLSADRPTSEPQALCEQPPPLPRPKRGIPRRHVEKVVNWIKHQIVNITNLEEIKQSVAGGDQDSVRRHLFRLFNKRFYLRLSKWRLINPYILRIHYLIIGGDADALSITESDFVENTYAWDMEQEIHLGEVGEKQVEIQVDGSQSYDLSTMAFKHISMQVELDEKRGTSNPVQWGKGMHFLEWSMAVHDLQPVDGRMTARLDMFYKCWSEAMNEVITLTTWGSFRAAGRAWFGARLLLLQFKNVLASDQHQLPGQIHWPGGGLSARRHPRACSERLLENQ